MAKVESMNSIKTDKYLLIVGDCKIGYEKPQIMKPIDIKNINYNDPMASEILI